MDLPHVNEVPSQRMHHGECLSLPCYTGQLQHASIDVAPLRVLHKVYSNVIGVQSSFDGARAGTDSFEY